MNREIEVTTLRPDHINSGYLCFGCGRTAKHAINIVSEGEYNEITLCPQCAMYLNVKLRIAIENYLDTGVPE
jgi:uncharacterized CHY-type Zn-finger protein